jgi:23S rRNA (pseudouridine1915-N3)-methyltransferase
MDWRLLAVGRFKAGPERALWEHHAARLRPPLPLTELPEGRGAPAEAARREGEALLAALPARALLIALDPTGASPDSEGLAALLERWRQAGRPLAFAIGGADGWHAAVLERADQVLSLGPLTWPHLLVRGLLAEQLFRAQAILSGHPYHRARRPEAR